MSKLFSLIDMAMAYGYWIYHLWMNLQIFKNKILSFQQEITVSDR